jgi:hypothetical protein
MSKITLFTSVGVEVKSSTLVIECLVIICDLACLREAASA